MVCQPGRGENPDRKAGTTVARSVPGEQIGYRQDELSCLTDRTFMRWVMAPAVVCMAIDPPFIEPVCEPPPWVPPVVPCMPAMPLIFSFIGSTTPLTSIRWPAYF